MRLQAVLSLFIVAVVSSSAASAQIDKSSTYMDSSLPLAQRVDDLVGRMTLEEKVSQMMNDAPEIPRLGVPAYNWWSEGLHGVARSGYATMFPQAIGMAATWDTDLIGREAEVISTEARAKYNEAIRHDIHSIYFGLTIWSPNINIFRDPRWGRGQETYGEDPYLTGQLGVAFVKGLQGSDPRYFKTIATPKHFAVHSGPESERHRFNVSPSAHDLWDTYLPAFRATITEGKADSLMCAYNAVDGVPACANKEILAGVLRGEWGFEGFVTSDCGAIDDFFTPIGHHYSSSAGAASVAGVRAGTDTNCGGTYHALVAAVRQGLVQEAEIDVSVKRLFLARYKLGLFDPDVKYAAIPFSEVNSAEHRALALEAARKSIVLLKNDEHALPLKQGVRTIAVIGPNAASLPALEGNYNAIPKDPVMPVDGIAAQFKGAKVLYAQGSAYVDGGALPVPRTVLHPSAGSGLEGLKGEYFAADDFAGQPVVTRVDKEIDFDWNAASPVDGVPQDRFAARWSGTITPPEPGEYEFSMRLPHCYPCHGEEKFAVYLDGAAVAGLDAPDPASRGTHFKLNFADAGPHGIRVEYRHNAKLFDAGIAMEWVPRVEPMRREAVALAGKADVVVAFVGLSPELEGEEMPVKVPGFAGGDRTDIQLPAAQQGLLEAVAATGKPLIVVLMNGSALAVNWAQQHAQAVLEAWYPGEEGARAIAETLDGTNNPGGRLPLTFYASSDQLPAFEDYSMANRTYRYFRGEPLYGFGFGLSYTTFTYSKLKLSSSVIHAGDALTVEADVENTGSREGDEVAQLYLVPPQGTSAPRRELESFTRVHLRAGEKKHLSFRLDARRLSLVDAQGARAVTPGSYGIYVGGGQPGSSGSGLSAEVRIDGKQVLPR